MVVATPCNCFQTYSYSLPLPPTPTSLTTQHSCTHTHTYRPRHAHSRLCPHVPPQPPCLLPPRVLPAPGQGPSLEAQRTGHWTHHLVAVTEEEPGAQPTIVTGTVGDR